MPSEKLRSKEDTWKPEELEKSLKGIRGDREKLNRAREERERRNKSQPKEEESHDRRRRSHHVEEDRGHHSRNVDDEREQRRTRHRADDDRDVGSKERRPHREKEGRDERRERREQHGTDDKPPRHRAEEDDERRRRHEEHRRRKEEAEMSKGRRKEEAGKQKPHVDPYGSTKQSREHRSEDRRRSHRDDDGEVHDRRDKAVEKERRENGHRRRDDDRKEKKSRAPKQDEDNKHKAPREHRGSHGSKEPEAHHRRRDEDKVARERSHKKEKPVASNTLTPVLKDSSDADPPDDHKDDDGGDNYDDYEDDFEDYEEDFEDDDDSDNDDAKDAAEDVRIKKMDDVDGVIKALDAENERIFSGSRRSNWSDSTELSDERFKPDNDKENRHTHDTHPRPMTGRSRTFINFVSAKQRAITNSAAYKTRKRARDLLKLVELDVTHFDMFDLPPVNEYDLYIRSFGRSDTKQAYIQTNEDNIERDVQTEEIQTCQMWTQHPSDDVLACGRGDGISALEETEASLSSVSLRSSSSTRLTTFVNKAAQAICILLEEESSDLKSESNSSQSNLKISSAFIHLHQPRLLQDRSVICTYFSPVQPNLLLTLYSQSSEPVHDNPLSSIGVICVWNTTQPTKPQKYLVCQSQPTCCCFSPGQPSLLFAGMFDGSVALWDLREATMLHKTISAEVGELVLRYPTYNTARVLEDENHHSPIISITPTVSAADSVRNVADNFTDSGQGLSYQLATIEENANLILWVVADVASADLAGSESDLGLLPGGRTKLLKSSSVSLSNPHRSLDMETSFRATCFQIQPADSNRFLIGTEMGIIVAGLRFGLRPVPRYYTIKPESPIAVTSIDFSPFSVPCFLVGYADGSVRLYHVKADQAIVTWPDLTNSSSVISVQWSASRPAVFYVLDANSYIHIVDIVENDSTATLSERVSNKSSVLHFNLCLDHSALGMTSASHPPHVLFSMEDGSVELHTVSSTYREQQPLEVEFLETYIERF